MLLGDLTIAAAAFEHSLSVFILDRHVEQMPGVVMYNASLNPISYPSMQAFSPATARTPLCG